MEIRLARCLFVAKVLGADGEVTDRERAFLDDAMDAAQLDDGERQRVASLDGWEEAEGVLGSMSMEDKRVLMDTLVHAVLADGKVSPEEMGLIERLSSALGLD